MAAFNVVRFKIKAGQEAAFLDAHREGKAMWPGLLRGTIIKVGERSYCLIGEWPSEEALAAARPAMIRTLDTFRATLEDLGEGRGVTDAFSGGVVLTIA
jgi:hypothetical protein